MGLSQSFVNLVREQNEDYIISLIEQKKVDIFARDDEERTALHWASAEGKKKIATVLIDHGVPVNSVDKHKYTPLHTAVFRNQEESAKLLIQKGIDINLQDEAGMTALHWAVYEHNYSCMQLLLRKGARLDIKNEKGQTVWDIARGLKKAHRNRVLEALQASSSVNEQGATMLSNWSSLTTKEIYLSSLCQLWGAIKFIHPYVAYREDVDWDLALVETLPKILNNSNLSPQDFKVVIVDMLKKLKDPNTIVANLEPSVQKLVQTPKPSKKQISSEQTPGKTDNQSAEPLMSSADRSSPIIPRANKAARQESRDSLPIDANDSTSSASESTTTPATPEPSRKPTSQPYVAIMSDNTGVIVTTDYNQFNDPQRYNALLQSMYTALNNCTSVIFDVRCRSTEPLKSSSALALSIMYYEAFKLFLTSDLFLPTYRHRTFHGYPEHRRGYSHMFHHGFMITDCEVLRPDPTQRLQFLQSLQTPATPIKTGSTSTPGTPLANSGSSVNLLASTEAPTTPMTPDRRQVNIGTPKTQRNTPAATPSKSLIPPGPQLPSLDKSLIFIIDQETPQGIVDIALALKSQYKAGIVYHAVPDDCYIDEVTSEMYLHEPGIAISVVNLPPSLKVFVRQNEKVNPDGTIGLRPDVVIKQEKRPHYDKDDANDAALGEAIKLAMDKAISNTAVASTGAVAAIFPKRKLDEEYKTMLFPNVEYRYLALFKLWNIVHYFYPYKDLLEKPWDQVLVESMPKFEACTTPLDYALAVTDVVNNMHDTHAYVRNSVLSTFTGTHVPPVKLRTIGNQTVVVQVEQLGLNDEPKEMLQVGDLILEIDGESVASKRAKLENLISASSPAAKVWRVDTKLLSGALGSVAKLKVQREVVSESGAKSELVLDVEVPRVIQAQQLQPLRQGPTFGLLDKVDDSGKQIGYMDLSRIQFYEVDPAMDALLHTNSLIIDLRGYIKGTIYKLAPRLVNRKVAVSRTTTPILSSSLLVDDLQSGSVVNQQYCTPATFTLNMQSGSASDANPAHYQGKIVALIDIETISHGEHSCLWLKACRPDCYFIGKPTSGTVGNITNLVLPGGVAVGFTSMGVQDRDGSQVQRVGIKPDLFVEETVESIKLNRDVILEAAIGHFQTKDPSQVVPQ